MRIRLTVDRASAYGLITAGSVLDMEADEACRLIEAGQALPEGEERETAVIGNMEKRRGRPPKAQTAAIGV